MESLIPFDIITRLIVPLLIVAVTGLVFGIMMVIAVWQWAKVAKARRWPVAAGTIVSSGVSESTDGEGSLMYSADVKYQYAVSGRMYTNDRLAFGSRNLSEGGSRGEKKAYRTITRYPAGASIQVVYDPSDPQSSVLELRSAVANMLAFIGVLFIVIGVIVAGLVFWLD